MKNKISACVVVYNEEKVIDRCLQSIKKLTDEIIVVHDGVCTDKTLEIAKKYTDKIFIRKHVGMMEAHLVYAFKHVSNDWILRIDADEYIDINDVEKIKNMVKNTGVDMYKFKWEMWNGHDPIHFKGLAKECLFRKSKYHFCGIPHGSGFVDGETQDVDIFLRHRPKYNNISWKSFLKKSKKWVPIHANYFFPDVVKYECINDGGSSWLKYIKKVKRYPLIYLIFYPIKNFLGQMKNGLWKNKIGINIALQQYFYYFHLHYRVWRIGNKKVNKKK
jgi:glycosyltransferase involved in cell wall biosynthesis